MDLELRRITEDIRAKLDEHSEAMASARKSARKGGLVATICIYEDGTIRLRPEL